ncbi:MAG: hypothetical protein J1F22_03625 [Lachnospiraceae bacterium]|nr:hypothetical protein [Lachnospiraceae bacterium]
MPFIDSKVTVKISPEKEEAIKKKLGQAITAIPGKSESWLMVGFEDEYTLYFKGEKCEKAAFVDVKVYGGANSQVYNQMTAEICKIYEEELGIPAGNIYIAYQGIADWGWNGGNL